MSILHVPVTFANIAESVRRAGGAINQLIAGKQDGSDNLTSIAGLTLTGNSGEVIAVKATEDGFELVAQSAGSGIADGDYGDVTVSGSGTVLTVDSDAITYAKIQNVSATDKLLGRSTAGAGDIEEIACTAAGRALLDDADAAAQRATLGAQAADATLTALAAHNTNGLLTQTAADTFTGRTITAGTGISVVDGDGGAGNPTIALNLPSVMVKKNADQTGANYSAGANIAWDAEIHDASGLHDSVTNNSRLNTPASATLVQVGCDLRLVNVTVGSTVQILLSKTGTSVFDGAAGVSDTTGLTNPRVSVVSGPIPVTGGTDYFEVILTCSDTSIDITASVSNFWLRVLA